MRQFFIMHKSRLTNESTMVKSPLDKNYNKLLSGKSQVRRDDVYLYVYSLRIHHKFLGSGSLSLRSLLGWHL